MSFHADISGNPFLKARNIAAFAASLIFSTLVSFYWKKTQFLDCSGLSACQPCYIPLFLSPCFLNWLINPNISSKYFLQENCTYHRVCVHSAPGSAFFKICFSKVFSGEFCTAACAYLSKEKMQYLFTFWPLTEIKM